MTNNKRFVGLFLVFILLFTITFLVNAEPDEPQTGPEFTVTSQIDSNDGICSVEHCSLREAVIAVNVLPYSSSLLHIIIPAGTYTLSLEGANEDFAATGDLDIRNSVSINGDDSTTTIIDANGIDRIFDIHTKRFELNKLSLTGGQADNGGALRLDFETSFEFFNVYELAIYGNEATLGAGLFLRNNIDNPSMLAQLESLYIHDNTSSSHGAGIYADTIRLVLSSSQVFNNTATGDGGGIYLLGAGLEILSSSLEGNSAKNGGAIAGINLNHTTTDLVIYVNLGIFRDNQALAVAASGGFGGSIYVTGDTPIVLEDSLLGNSTALFGGAIAVNAYNGEDDPSLAELINSSVVYNKANQAGAVWVNNTGFVLAENSTISNNNASGNGGAFYLNSGDLFLKAMTIVENDAAQAAGGIYIVKSQFTVLMTSILANNNGGDCVTSYTNPSVEYISSQDYNYIEDFGNCYREWLSFPDEHDVFGQNPSLSSLTKPDDYHWVHYPFGDLIDAIPSLSCNNIALTNDELGTTRPLGSACDIGAVEGLANLTAPTNLSASYASSKINLTWDDNTNAETSYTLERSSDNGATWLSIAGFVANTESYADTDLTCGTSYQYRLWAYTYSSANYSPLSNIASVTVNCTVAAPTNLYTEPETYVGSDSVNLQWMDNANNETSFRIERSEDYGVTWLEVGELPANVNNNNTYFFDAALDCATSFHYRVRAYNSNTGEYSPYSNIIEATTDPCVEPPLSSICTVHPLDIDVNMNYPQLSFLSGDGNRIAVLEINSNSSNALDDLRLNLFDTTTGDLLAVIPSTTDRLDISDDGRKIIFASRADYTGGNPDQNFEFFLWNEGDYTQLTHTIFTSDVMDYTIPHISGNGLTISFMVRENLFTNIHTPTQYYYYVWQQSTGLQFLTNISSAYLASGWETAITDDGNILIFTHDGNLTGQDPNHDGMLYRKNLTTNVISSISPSPWYFPFSIAINADASRISAVADPVTNQNPDGNMEVYLWDSINEWRQITELPNELAITPITWLDDSGYRLLILSDKNLTGENPADPKNPQTVEYIVYDDGIGFSQITNHNTRSLFQYGRSLSDDGTKAGFVLYSGHIDTVNTNPFSLYTVYIADCSPPPAPSSVVLAPYYLRGGTATTSLSLRWEDASSNETAFLLERSDDSANWQALATLAANTESYTDTGLVCNAVYYYRVRAYSSSLSKYSPYSGTLPLVTDFCDLPRPSNFRVTGTTINSISLAWTDNGISETAFLLERSPNGSNWQQIASLAAESTSYTDSGLSCSTSYSYRLRTFDSATTSYSIYTPILIASSSACSQLAPSTLSITEQRNFELDLAWTAVPLATSYNVYELTAGGALNLLVSLPISSTSHTVSNLACYSNHTYTVIARRAVDNATSRSNDVSMSVTACPAAPTNLTATPSVDVISLQWLDNANNETAYELQRNVSGGAWTALETMSADSTSYNNTGLECQTSYNYRLRAYNSVTEAYSPWLSVNSATTTCPALLPSTISSTGATSNSISLDWTVDTTATTFTLWYSKGAQWVSVGSFNESNHSFSQTGLSCATSYQYRIQTYRQPDNATNYSTVLSASTAACAPLAAPAAPILLNADVALVSLQIPSLPAGATSMRLGRSTDGVNWQVLGLANGSYFDTTVACASNYQYRLEALRNDEVSAASPVTNATTLACPTPILSMVGVYKDGRWRFSNAQNLSFELSFGSQGWKPLAGDWDGDGEEGLALYNGTQFIIRNDMNDANNDNRFNFGNGDGWQAISGDWNADGKDTIGIYRNGLFILSDDNQNEQYRFNLGADSAGFTPIAGDWDGNGADSIGIYRGGHWMLSDSVQNPEITRNFSFGPDAPNWHPVAGDWNGDGLDGVGVYGYGSWRLRETASDAAAERSMLFGDSATGWMPLSTSPFTPTTPPETIPVLDDDDDSDGLSNGDENAIHGTDPQIADTDGDGLGDGEEVIIHETNPLSPDSDADNLSDADEINLYGSNPNNSNSDNDSCIAADGQTRSLNDSVETTGIYAQGHEDADDDGIYNSMELDADGDLLEDCSEVYYFATNPYNPNTDGDDLNDYSETRLFCRNPKDSSDSGDTCNLDTDTDADGLMDYDELVGVIISTIINDIAVSRTVYLDPTDADSDSDGLSDGDEVLFGIYPDDADTDDDGISDGDEENLYGSDPRENDTDSDGLMDNIEIVGISNYSMTVDGITVTVNLAGYNAPSGLKLSIFNPDSDSDGLSDGDEVNVYHTNPLDFDTDGDGFMDSGDPDPLDSEVTLDNDGDGIENDDETNAIPPTDPNDYDSDGDRMGDGDEVLSLALSATGYNLTTNATYAISYNTNINLNTTFQDSDLDTILDGYDSDKDGLSDVYEMYWYRSGNFIRAIHPQFTAFSGSMETCSYALTGSQPLHPDNADMDADGLRDGDECNVYATNPFSAALEGPIFDKISNSTFLDSVVYPALEGDLELSAASARALGYTVASDGRITVYIVRSMNPSLPTKRLLMGTLITSACGPSAYTNAIGITSYFANVCGVFVGTEPNANNNDASSPVQVRIPLSQFFTILRSSTVLSLSPTTSNTAPTANFTVPACIAGTACTFTNTSTDSDGSIVSSAWTFGDSTSSTSTSPSKTYASEGTYSVTLTVTDNGGLSNSISKSVTVTSAAGSDSDLDALPDTWEINYFGSISLYDGTGDPDADSCNNLCEYDRLTDPTDSDTDDDGLTDGQEIATNAKDSDTDDDGLLDGQEANGMNFSTTINGVAINQIIYTDPLLVDTDSDGLSDYQELITYYTYPDDPDSDGDGVSDGQEVNTNGTDPLNTN